MGTGERCRGKRRRGGRIYSAAMLLAALIGTLAIADSAGAQAVPQTLEFEIAHEGDVVGHHRVTFRRDGDKLIVHSELEIELAVLFLHRLPLPADPRRGLAERQAHRARQHGRR